MMNRYLQQLRDPDPNELQPEPIAQAGHILSNWRLILCVASLVTLLGMLYAMSVTPVYQANILIQLKRHAPLSGDVQIDIPASTEVEILRSRSIVSRVVNTLQLDINVEPKLFPVVGAFIASKNKNLSTPGLFGHGGYVWGAEQVQVSQFNVPTALLRQPFVLTTTGATTYTLSQKEMGLILKGTLAQLARVDSRHGPIEILVSDIQSKPGAQFFVSRSPTFQVAEQLQRSLAISENGKLSNVIGVSLRGSKPELISRILNEIGNQYIQLQLVQKSDDTRKALALYNQQLEESNARLQRLDARFTQVLRRHGISDLGEEARALVQQSVALQTELAEKEQRKAELTGRFLDKHPEVIVVTRQIQELQRDLDSLEARRMVLAGAQHEILGIERDKQINSEINIALLNNRRKLDTLTLSNDANVRLVDRAETPNRPVTMGLPVMVGIACLLGIVLGVAASILKNAIIDRKND